MYKFIFHTLDSFQEAIYILFRCMTHWQLGHVCIGKYLTSTALFTNKLISNKMCLFHWINEILSNISSV